MKILLFFCIPILFACSSGKQQDYTKAEDALDAGREYIQSCLQGDFSKAAFYVVPNDQNKNILEQLEKVYREKDKEGRQQFRLASINIIEVAEIDQTHTMIRFSNSFEKRIDTVEVFKKNDTWLVNLSGN